MALTKNAVENPWRIDRLFTAVLLASCLVVPLLFLPSEDAFALPKVTALRVLVVVGFALLLARVALTDHTAPARFELIDGAVLVFATLNVLAYIFSIDREQSLNGERLQYQGLLTLLTYIGFYVFARVVFREESRVILLFAAISVGATGVATYAVLQRLQLDPIWGAPAEGRVFSTIGQPNALAAYLLLAVPIALALSTRMRGGSRFLLLTAGALMVCALVLTYSRGGYLALALATPLIVPALVLHTRVRLRTLVSGALIVSVIAVASYVTVQPIRTAATDIGERAASAANLDEPSVRTHLDLWRVGAAMAVDYPVLGAGQEMYPELFPSYRDSILAADRAAELRRFRPEGPHNQYLALAAGVGFPALLAYIAIVGGILVLAARVLRTIPATRWRFIAIVAMVTAVIGHVITDTFMTAEVTSTWLFWMLLGALTSACTAAPRTRTRNVSAAALILHTHNPLSAVTEASRVEQKRT